MFGREHHPPAVHHRLDTVQPILKGRDDSEVPAAAAQPPQKIRVLVLTRPHVTAVGRDHIGADEIVAGQPESPRQSAVATAERETSCTGVRHRACRCRQTEELRLAIELTKQHAGLDVSDAGERIDMDAFHG